MSNQTALFYGILGGATAVFMEAMMKKSGFSWLSSLYWLAPLALLVNYSVYRMVQSSPSLPAAIIIFSTSTLTLRVMVSWLSGHHIGPGTWAAVGLFIVGLVLRMIYP